jgi:hypothetical protein
LLLQAGSAVYAEAKEKEKDKDKGERPVPEVLYLTHVSPSAFDTPLKALWVMVRWLPGTVLTTGHYCSMARILFTVQ